VFDYTGAVDTFVVLFSTESAAREWLDKCARGRWKVQRGDAYPDKTADAALGVLGYKAEVRCCRVDASISTLM
jgi:hypothetical protein